jgi:hypothetical protein
VKGDHPIESDTADAHLATWADVEAGLRNVRDLITQRLEHGNPPSLFGLAVALGAARELLIEYDDVERRKSRQSARELGLDVCGGVPS